MVVATSAMDFHAAYGRWPDFEILETATAVPNLLDDPSWGHTEAFLQLGNQGDEVILRDADGSACGCAGLWQRGDSRPDDLARC